MINNLNEKISKWKELGIFFKGRSTAPLEHPEFIVYFLLVIIGFGAIGIWSSFITVDVNSEFSHTNLINNIASFSVAIIATGSIELMFIENKIIKTPLFLISLGIIAISSVFFLLLFNSKSLNSYYFAIPFLLFSLYTWWIANAENANLTKNYFVQQSEESNKLNKSLNDYDE